MNQGEDFSRNFDIIDSLLHIYSFYLKHLDPSKISCHFLLSFTSFFLRETFNTGVEKLEKLELIKFEEISKNNVKVYHFKMQVDIQLSSATVVAYFNERLALEIL